MSATVLIFFINLCLLPSLRSTLRAMLLLFNQTLLYILLMQSLLSIYCRELITSTCNLAKLHHSKKNVSMDISSVENQYDTLSFIVKLLSLLLK